MVIRGSNLPFTSFSDGNDQYHLDGWRFYVGQAWALKMAGILRPLPQVVTPDTCTDHKWRVAGRVTQGEEVDGHALDPGMIWRNPARFEAAVMSYYVLVGVREEYHGGHGM